MKQNWIIIAGLLLVGSFAIYQFYPPDNHQSPASGNDPMVTVEIPLLSNEAMEGEKLFNANCAVCHGLNAAGKQGVAPPLVHIIYEPGHHGDMAFQLAAQNGVRAHHWPFGNMPAVKSVMSDEVSQITRYVRELQRANGIF